MYLKELQNSFTGYCCKVNYFEVKFQPESNLLVMLAEVKLVITIFLMVIAADINYKIIFV